MTDERSRSRGKEAGRQRHLKIERRLVVRGVDADEPLTG